MAAQRIKLQWTRQCTWTPEAWLRQVAAFLGYARVIKPVLSLPDHAGLVSQACELRCSTQLSPLTLQVLLPAGALRSLSRRDWVPHISSCRCYYVTGGFRRGQRRQLRQRALESTAGRIINLMDFESVIVCCFAFDLFMIERQLILYQLYQSMKGLILHERCLNHISYINPWWDWYCMKET